MISKIVRIVFLDLNWTISKRANTLEKYFDPKMYKILPMADIANDCMNSMDLDGITMYCLLCIPAIARICTVALFVKIIVPTASDV